MDDVPLFPLPQLQSLSVENTAMRRSNGSYERKRFLHTRTDVQSRNQILQFRFVGSSTMFSTRRERISFDVEPGFNEAELSTMTSELVFWPRNSLAGENWDKYQRPTLYFQNLVHQL